MKLEQFNSFELQRLHSIFRGLTDSPRLWTLAGGVEMIWAAWAREGFNEEDLRLVVAYIKRNMKPRGHFHPASLGFEKLIGNPGLFADRLGEARQAERVKDRQVKPETPRQEILRASGRPTVEQKEAQPAGQIAAEELKAMYAKLRADL